MTYDARERSIQDGQPVEIYTFELPGETFRLTSHDQDVVFDGNTYTAATISRGNVSLGVLGKARELVITIARNHPLASALRGGGIPTAAIVTIRRFHVGDAESRRLWHGRIKGTTSEGESMQIAVPDRMDEIFNVSLPVVTAQRSCSHRLGDRGCTLDLHAAGFVISPTVASVSGTALVVSSMSGKPTGWASLGKVKRLADGVERSILVQTGATLTLDEPFGVLLDGDALEVYAGCDLTLEGANGCFAKFDNVVNFGGEPEMPIGNPSSPTGYGVTVQV